MKAEADGAFTIRKGTVADAALLAELAARTFTDAFARDNTPANMAAHIAHAYGVPQQTAELADPDGVTLIGDVGAAAMAYAQVRRGPAPACITGRDPVELRRFYVEQRWHGRGIARALMDAVFETARALGANTLWLGVWERNPRAIAFYVKCGFLDRGSQDFWLGADRQTDRVLVRSLAPSTNAAWPAP
jgi:GNAT superfamily N-acetyltransferase